MIKIGDKYKVISRANKELTAKVIFIPEKLDEDGRKYYFCEVYTSYGFLIAYTTLFTHSMTDEIFILEDDHDLDWIRSE
jgi:hypothetical protein